MKKVISIEEAKLLIRYTRMRDGTSIFTNGCFDGLHRGHKQLLKRAKAMGDVLIVGLNTDSSYYWNKGRFPTIKFRNRCRAILSTVDCYIVPLSERTPEALLQELRPCVLVKGADWKLTDIIGKRFVGKVVRLSLLKSKGQKIGSRKRV